MLSAISITELYLIALATIFTIPCPIWRIARINYCAPLVVVQIIAGILRHPVGQRIVSQAA